MVHLPDIGAEVRSFDAPAKRPVAWWPHVVNAAWGGASERSGTWMDRNWEIVDYVDRAANANCHDYLKHRGIWWEVYGSNEYQESIHFHEEGVRKLLWNNGIAQDMNGQRVLSEDFNMKVAWWAKEIGWDAFITCNNAPRWSAIIDYDWLTSPLRGFAISQDNIGGPTSRIGAGGHGRYCDYCSAKFFDHLARTGRLPEFRRRYRNIREYVQANLMDVVRQWYPYAKWRGDAAEAKVLARLCEPPVMSEYQKFLYGGKIATEVTVGRLFTWPYQEPAPLPLQTNLGCGGPREFRVDLPPGEYTIRVVTTNTSWTNHNFQVSGMVRVNGEVRLLDAVHDLGALVARELAVSIPDGKLEFTFGGPTGLAVAAMVITPGTKPPPDPQAAHGLRLWHVSPRYANPDWYPINQVAFSPERRLAHLPDADWKPVKAPARGLPVVDLGTSREADIGNVVYATTTIDASAPRKVLLHFGASSQAQLWLNNTPIGYVPNEKGLRRDELVVPIKLCAGKNVLVVKLQRFWERRWMFYASLTELGGR